MARWLRALLGAWALVALVGCGVLVRPAPTPIPPAVHLDTSGANEFLAFLRALEAGKPWDEDSVRRLVASAPYQTLVAHHSSLEPEFTSDGLVRTLLALGTDDPFANPSVRLKRIYAAWWSMRGRASELETRLGRVADPAVLERAVKRARAALPPQARLEATVYVLADGCSPAYTGENSVTLDLLQIDSTDGLEGWLAHELHHVAMTALLPKPCSDENVGVALDGLGGLVQEGSATYYIDGWRATPSADDYRQVQAYLSDVLQGRLSRQDTEARLADLLGERGPLYRVGNEMVAKLAAANGDAWVQARLGDPIGLLRAYSRTGRWPGSQDLLALLDKSKGKCPDWFSRGR